MSAFYRIDVGLEYTSADAFTITQGVDTHTVTLGSFIPPTGVYDLDFHASLASQGIAKNIKDHLNHVSSGFTVTESNGKYTISHASTFTMAFANLSIRAFLGFSNASYSGANTYTSDVQSPGVFLGQRPCVVIPGFRWYTKRTGVFRDRALTHNTAAFDLYRVRLRITKAEVESWRVIARYLLQGSPFRFWQTPDDGSISGFSPSTMSGTNKAGTFDATLTNGQIEMADNWYNTDLLDEMTVEFVAVRAVT